MCVCTSERCAVPCVRVYIACTRGLCEWARACVCFVTLLHDREATRKPLAVNLCSDCTFYTTQTFLCCGLCVFLSSVSLPRRAISHFVSRHFLSSSLSVLSNEVLQPVMTTTLPPSLFRFMRSLRSSHALHYSPITSVRSLPPPTPKLPPSPASAQQCFRIV